MVEELAQHASAEWQRRLADQATPTEAQARVRTLIDGWVRDTALPRRRQRDPLLVSAPASASRSAGLVLDLRHSLRLFRRQPGFAVVSITMIAVGISATSAVFSVVNGVLLRPLPWPNAARLVHVSETR
ncbi:MAG: hypothetical protein P8Y95_17395, partial [Gammaproteobacteria bacterium]